MYATSQLPVASGLGNLTITCVDAQVNYGGLLLQALLEHWPRPYVDEESEMESQMVSDQFESAQLEMHNFRAPVAAVAMNTFLSQAILQLYSARCVQNHSK